MAVGVRDVPFEGSTREECAFAVRRAHRRDVPDTRLFITYMQATGSRQGRPSLS